MTISAHPTAGPDDLGALLDGVGKGDAATFATFYDLTAQRVYGMALRVIRDRGFSEEITQEVYLTVWRTANTFDGSSGSALSWVLTMAHRRAVDRVRSEVASRRRTLAHGQAAITPPFDEVTEISERREAARLVRSGLQRLTPAQRESIELAYFDGLTYREVAERLQVALPTVKSRIRDGMRRLRLSVADTAA